MAITKEDFVKEYCKNSSVSVDDYNKHCVALPCNCRENICQGWATIPNNKLSIEAHNRVYGTENNHEK